MAGREIFHRQLSAKQANPDELKQMPQMYNFEAPNPAASASEQTALSVLNCIDSSGVLAVRRSTCEQSTR